MENLGFSSVLTDSISMFFSGPVVVVSIFVFVFILGIGIYKINREFSGPSIVTNNGSSIFRTQSSRRNSGDDDYEGPGGTSFVGSSTSSSNTDIDLD